MPPGREINDREISPASAFAVGLRQLNGPCSNVACPMVDGEQWAPGKCTLENCPRRKTAALGAVQAESFARAATINPGQDE